MQSYGWFPRYVAKDIEPRMTESPATKTPGEEARRVAAGWQVPEKPHVPRGWLVYSESFVLRILQGRYGAPGDVVHSPGWRLAAGLVRGAMGAAQALLMLLSSLPLVGSAMEFWATNFGRGSIGFFLRACYWKTRLRRLGQDTLIDRGVTFWGPGAIEVGSACHIDSDARLAGGEAGQGQHGRIVIGDFTHIGPRTNIAGRGGVRIGDCVSIQGLVHIYSATTALLDPKRPSQLLSLSHMPPPELQHIVEGPVEIDDYAAVAFACLILPGAKIGRGAIVHPYCQVSGTFEPFANVVGPGRARQNGWRRCPRPVDPAAERPSPLAANESTESVRSS